MTTRIPDAEEIRQSIDDCTHNPYCLKLIQFFGCYPDIGFTGLSLLNALEVNNERQYIEDAITLLIDKGVVKSYSEHNIPYYGLTDRGLARQAALTSTIRNA